MKSGAGSPSATKPASSRRAVGVVRVSRVGGREGEAFVSPSEQRQRIGDACARDGLELLETIDELDVSGGAPLAQRPGLSRALSLIEAGDADVLVVAYFDRLVRSIARQAEILERVEAAGGSILAVDVGEVSADTAGRWLSSTMLGMVAEYHRRVTGERTADAKRRAVARGVAPFPRLPPGYQRADDGRVEVDSETATAVAEAFRLRAEGTSIKDVQAHLRRHGIERSWHGTQAMLASRVYLGELHFGALANLESHTAIVDRFTWQRVQRMRVSRGRQPKSERLLARLGVLRCGTCGGRLVIGSTDQKGKRHYMYRCSPVGDCPRRVSISADLIERVVVEAVQDLLQGMRGTAAVEQGVEEAEREFERSDHELDAAVRAFTGLEDVDSARERLLELRAARDAAQTRAAELRAATAPALTVSASGEWDLLSREEQRALIRAVIERVDVAPGRGRERITVHPRTQ